MRDFCWMMVLCVDREGLDDSDGSGEGRFVSDGIVVDVGGFSDAMAHKEEEDSASA